MIICMILKSGDPFLPLPYQGTGASSGEDHPQEKRAAGEICQLGVDNYWKYVTDLIGIRVFFLYREDWRHFMNTSHRRLKMPRSSM